MESEQSKPGEVWVNDDTSINTSTETATSDELVKEASVEEADAAKPVVEKGEEKETDAEEAEKEPTTDALTTEDALAATSIEDQACPPACSRGAHAATLPPLSDAALIAFCFFLQEVASSESPFKKQKNREDEKAATTAT